MATSIGFKLDTLPEQLGGCKLLMGIAVAKEEATDARPDRARSDLGSLAWGNRSEALRGEAGADAGAGAPKRLANQSPMMLSKFSAEFLHVPSVARRLLSPKYL